MTFRPGTTLFGFWGADFELDENTCEITAGKEHVYLFSLMAGLNLKENGEFTLSGFEAGTFFMGLNESALNRCFIFSSANGEKLHVELKEEHGVDLGKISVPTK